MNYIYQVSSLTTNEWRGDRKSGATFSFNDRSPSQGQQRF